MKKAALTLLMLATFSYLYCANFKDMANIVDISGKIFGDFRAKYFHTKDKYYNALWVCSCVKCGREKILISSRLTHGRNVTCYCEHHHNHKHGDCNKTKEYRAYRHMLNRCYNNKVRSYPHYGGRGITVCDRWLESYENFLADMGRAPTPKHSLDRQKVNENYEPDNCKWSTPVEQANNTTKTYMIEFKGNEMPLGLFCRQYNLPIELIRGRLNNGWGIERAMTTPNQRTNQPI